MTNKDVKPSLAVRMMPTSRSCQQERRKSAGPLLPGRKKITKDTHRLSRRPSRLPNLYLSAALRAEHRRNLVDLADDLGPAFGREMPELLLHNPEG